MRVNTFVYETHVHTRRSVHVCTCICTCMYVYTLHVHTCMYVYTCICTCMYVYMYMYVRLYYVHVCTCICTCMYVYMYMYVRVYVYVCTYVQHYMLLVWVYPIAGLEHWTGLLDWTTGLMYACAVRLIIAQ